MSTNRRGFITAAITGGAAVALSKSANACISGTSIPAALAGGNGALSIVQQDMFYVGGMVRCMRVARMAHALGKQCIPHSGPYHEFKEFNNDLPFTCATSTLRSNETEW